MSHVVSLASIVVIIWNHSNKIRLARTVSMQIVAKKLLTVIVSTKMNFLIDMITANGTSHGKGGLTNETAHEINEMPGSLIRMPSDHLIWSVFHAGHLLLLGILFSFKFTGCLSLLEFVPLCFLVAIYLMNCYLMRMSLDHFQISFG